MVLFIGVTGDSKRSVDGRNSVVKLVRTVMHASFGWRENDSRGS